MFMGGERYELGSPAQRPQCILPVGRSHSQADTTVLDRPTQSNFLLRQSKPDLSDSCTLCLTDLDFKAAPRKPVVFVWPLGFCFCFVLFFPLSSLLSVKRKTFELKTGLVFGLFYSDIIWTVSKVYFLQFKLKMYNSDYLCATFRSRCFIKRQFRQILTGYLKNTELQMLLYILQPRGSGQFPDSHPPTDECFIPLHVKIADVCWGGYKLKLTIWFKRLFMLNFVMGKLLRRGWK